MCIARTPSVWVRFVGSILTSSIRSKDDAPHTILEHHHATSLVEHSKAKARLCKGTRGLGMGEACARTPLHALLTLVFSLTSSHDGHSGLLTADAGWLR